MTASLAMLTVHNFLPSLSPEFLIFQSPKKDPRTGIKNTGVGLPERFFKIVVTKR
jgi:hypothetical protein